jgi:hypothetical protein
MTKNVVEHWNGTSWLIQPSPTPANVTQTSLYGISCTTTAACFAIGGDTISDSNNTLIERNS